MLFVLQEVLGPINRPQAISSARNKAKYYVERIGAEAEVFWASEVSEADRWRRLTECYRLQS